MNRVYTRLDFGFMDTFQELASPAMARIGSQAFVQKPQVGPVPNDAQWGRPLPQIGALRSQKRTRAV